ncbi:MAG: tyrosine-type recombinase/integrase [Solirubrobacteraceae bacterium]
MTVSVSVPVAGCAAFRVRPPGDLGYWSVRDGAYELIPAADTYLRYLRYSRGRALGTTEKYAGNLAVFFDWCAGRQFGLVEAAQRMDGFVLVLRNQLVTRPGRGVGQPRSNGRVNHILVAVREMYKSAVADGLVGEDTIGALFVMGEVADGGAAERPVRRFALRPRHVLRAEAPGEVDPVTREEFNALMRVTLNWRDRLLLVLMRHVGLRRGEAVMLQEEDLHLMADARELGCGARVGAHLHVRRRTSEQGSSAKSSRGRTVPVDAVVVFCSDRWYYERERVPGAERSVTVLVNLDGPKVGGPMRVDQVNAVLTDLGRRAGLERRVTPHMLRHAWATRLAGVADLAVVKDLIGHRQLATTARYVHPEWDRVREAIDRAYLEEALLDRAGVGDEC